MVEQPRPKRMSFINWLVHIGVLSVFAVLIYSGLRLNWQGNGLPSWMSAYLEWERSNLPWIYNWIQGLIS